MKYYYHYIITNDNGVIYPHHGILDADSINEANGMLDLKCLYAEEQEHGKASAKLLLPYRTGKSKMSDVELEEVKQIFNNRKDQTND